MSLLVGETLLLYLAVSEQAISAVLAADRAKEKIPVYYISHALAGAEIHYLLIEKFAYALVIVSQKLWPYFEAHKVIVLTDQPLNNVLQRLDTSYRLLKWAVELLQYDLAFESGESSKPRFWPILDRKHFSYNGQRPTPSTVESLRRWFVHKGRKRSRPHH